ncbi:MAG: formimidoylglutamate deiminase [Proteobacteria bacterium]|nr:formimidoylglutamate deiminase [Pseudomonadota bacterium]
MNSYFFKFALLSDGWHKNVRAQVDKGVYQMLEPDGKTQANDQVFSVVIPAMPNVHSHVFQRAMSGLTEYKSSKQDSFWSWRDLMYKLAATIDDDQLYEIAKNCYQEMLDAGYGSVCEFHYLHRDLKQTENTLNMSKAILCAAHDVGIGMTFLPVLYSYSGLIGQPLTKAQQRFGMNVRQYLQLQTDLDNALFPEQKLGLCFHSIRAVTQQQITQVLAESDPQIPVHIHIAEQQTEIEQSIKHYGKRPVEWLYDNYQVDKRWSLVHATHLNSKEIELIAQSKAVVGLCPLTEANLGDGIFPMKKFMAHQGRFAIGSDSHIQLNPSEELKMLEYSQRLKEQQRNICSDNKHKHVGTYLWLNALKGGAQASGLNVAGIQTGQKAQFLSLENHSPYESNLTPEQILDGMVFSGLTKSALIKSGL